MGLLCHWNFHSNVTMCSMAVVKSDKPFRAAWPQPQRQVATVMYVPETQGKVILPVSQHGTGWGRGWAEWGRGDECGRNWTPWEGQLPQTPCVKVRKGQYLWPWQKQMFPYGGDLWDCPPPCGMQHMLQWHSCISREDLDRIGLILSFGFLE